MDFNLSFNTDNYSIPILLMKGYKTVWVNWLNPTNPNNMAFYGSAPFSTSEMKKLNFYNFSSLLSLNYWLSVHRSTFIYNICLSIYCNKWSSFNYIFSLFQILSNLCLSRSPNFYNMTGLILIRLEWICCLFLNKVDSDSSVWLCL